MINKIRDEYPKIAKENESLKSTLKQYKDELVGLKFQRWLQKEDRIPSYVSNICDSPRKKVKYNYDDYDYENDTEYYIHKRKKQWPKKTKIIYEDNVDGGDASNNSTNDEEYQSKRNEEDDDDIYEAEEIKPQRKKAKKIVQVKQ